MLVTLLHTSRERTGLRGGEAARGLMASTGTNDHHGRQLRPRAAGKAPAKVRPPQNPFSVTVM